MRLAALCVLVARVMFFFLFLNQATLMKATAELPWQAWKTGLAMVPPEWLRVGSYK